MTLFQRHNRAHEQLVRYRALRHVHPLGSLPRSADGNYRGPWSAAAPRCPADRVSASTSIIPLAKTFNPVKFDARDIARRAQRAGMQYGVLTTKHHDGYAMFHTRESDCGHRAFALSEDIVRQYAEAFRAEGLKVGFYFSLIDWHHPDYPAFKRGRQALSMGQMAAFLASGPGIVSSRRCSARFASR